MGSLGKLLILAGLVLVLLGCFLTFGGKSFPLGRLPGDIRVERENFSFYFPVVSCIVVSVVFSLLFWIFSRFK
jgi:heme/copper-type cytochrome/quinol oxidase subunit 2